MWEGSRWGRRASLPEGWESKFLQTSPPPIRSQSANSPVILLRGSAWVARRNLCVTPGRRNAFSLRRRNASACWMPLPRDGDGTGPDAAPCPRQLPAHPGSICAHPCPRCPFGELPHEGSPRSSIPSPRQPISGPVSGTLCLGSINNAAILPGLSRRLSCRLMLGQRQASLWEAEDEDANEDEDGLVAGQGHQSQRSLRTCLTLLWPPWGRQGWLGTPAPALCSMALAASGTASRGIRTDDLVREGCTLICL